MRKNSHGVVYLLSAVMLLLARPAGAGELIQNGSFETGDFGPYWVHGAYRGKVMNPSLADNIVVTDLPYTGSYCVRLGFKYSRERKSAVGFMYQDVTIPADISDARLFFKVRQQGYDTDPYDPFRAEIRDLSGAVVQSLLTLTFSDPSYVFKDGGWVDDDGSSPVGVDMTPFAGQTIRVYFEQANTNDNLWETWAYVDDVSLIFRKFVDLAVDGDGDDVFGAPGTGGGGFSAQSTVAGTPVVFDLDVENEGLDTDSYVLSITAPPGWIVSLDAGSGPLPFPFTTPAMPPGAVTRYEVTVTPPAGTPEGYYGIVVDAVSESQANRFDSAALGIFVFEASYGVDLAVEGNGYGVVGDGGAGGFALKTGTWSAPAAYALEIMNTGDVPEAVRVDWTSDPGATSGIWHAGVWHAAPFTTTVISPGSSAAMTLEISVPAPEAGGDYETIVYARSAADTLERDSAKAIFRLLAPRVDIVIGGNGENIYDGTFSGLGGTSSTAGEVGLPVMFPVTIQNEGGIADSYDLSWQKPTGGWSAAVEIGGIDYALPHTTPVVPAYSSLHVVLKVFPPANTKVGTYSSYLHAVSVAENEISESVTAAVSITEAGQIDLLIDGSGEGVFGYLGTGLGGASERVIAPGDSTTFAVELRNLSGADAAEISWNTPPGWRITFDGRTSPISNCTSGVYELKVVVPAASAGGTFDIIVDAQKTDRRYYVDSVRGRLYVQPTMVVDALIDGNGDGVYGAPGTGLGGSSAQTRSAPAALRFTVELQNEGTDPDSYTLTWNQIPLWPAACDGFSSPYATAPIGPGGSLFLSFEVTVPVFTFPGDYRYVIDVVSNAHPTVDESIEARITIVGPPRADLVIDGNGFGVFGPIGSGEGGQSLRSANPGTAYTSTLEVRNVGSFADSFLVFWQPPPGWPQSSVVLSDGVTDYVGPFWTPMIGDGASRFYTVRVQVPPGTSAGTFNTIIDSHSSLAPQLPESIRLITQTAAVVTGVAFDDRDHDGVLGAGDAGIGGVTVTETAGGGAFTTGGDGRYVFLIAGGAAVTVIEQNLSNFISLTPDTVGPATLSAGDTLFVDFGDVPGIRLSAGAVGNGIAGSFVDFAHRIDAGTKGAVSLSAAVDPDAVTVFFLDENEDGVFNGADRAIEPADLDMDPSAGRDHVCLLLRVFVPIDSAPGTTHTIDVVALQVIDGTPLTSRSSALDAVLVVDGSAGLLTIHKQVDPGSALPGDVLGYTIEFTNTGLDSVRSIVVLDPVSVFVDPVVDAFGPGMDVEWRKDGSTTIYLTFAPGDGDECDYAAADRLLRVELSRNAPYMLAPGERGRLMYKVIVK